MNKEIPPGSGNIVDAETFKDTRELSPNAVGTQKNADFVERAFEETGRHKKVLSPEEQDQIDTLLAKAQYESSVDRQIDDANTKKPKGDEEDLWKIPVGTMQRKPSNKLRNMRMALKIGFTGLFGLFAGKALKAATTNPGDSTKNNFGVVVNKGNEDSTRNNKSTAEMGTSKAKSPYEEDFSSETVGNITIRGNIFIPQSDTTKEVYGFYFSNDGGEETKIQDMIDIMAKKGYRPVNQNTSISIYNQNKNDPKFVKKIKWFIAPTPIDDADDTRMNEKVITTKTEDASVYRKVESNKKYDVLEEVPITVHTVSTKIPTHVAFPSISPVGPGRVESDSGISFDEHGFLFEKDIQK